MSTERERYMSNEEVDQLIADLNDPLYRQGYRDGYARGNAEVAKLRGEVDQLRLSTTYEPEGVDIVMGQLQKLRAESDEVTALNDKLRKLLDGVANVVNGSPEELTQWSWHDLPERTEKAIHDLIQDKQVITELVTKNRLRADRAVADLAALRDRVRALHYQLSWTSPNGKYAFVASDCAECHREFPCPTIRALDGGEQR